MKKEKVWFVLAIKKFFYEIIINQPIIRYLILDVYLPLHTKCHSLVNNYLGCHTLKLMQKKI